MDRRTFLGGTLAFTGSLLTGCANLPFRNKPRAVIVGAGLSGLATALELRKKGFEVLVLEATARHGGRVLTQREGFPGELYSEQGPTIIPDTHQLVHGYIRQFGLPLMPVPIDKTRTLYYFRKRKYLEGEENNNDYPSEWKLNADEDNGGLEWMQDDYFRRSFAEMGNPLEPGWIHSPAAKRLDGLTFVDYLRSKGASSMAIDMELAVEGSDGKRVSAALWLAQAFLDQKITGYSQIRGGNDLLPAALAKALGQSILYSSPVHEIRKENQKTFVSYRSQNKIETMEADFVIFAVSPPVLRKIKFSPGLSSPKQSAIEAVQLAAATKTSLAMRERFWKKLPVNRLPVAYTDTPMERVWDMSLNQPGKMGMLVAYCQEKNARALGALPEKEQISRALAQMEEFLPGSRKNFLSGSSFSWQHQEWAGNGAWVSYTKHQLPLLRELGRSEDNFYFAGDHTSLRCAWMEGALESAHRVVGEVSDSYAGHSASGVSIVRALAFAKRSLL